MIKQIWFMRKIGEMRVLELFTPDYYIHGLSALCPEYLLEHGIHLLVCNIDNTLVSHGVTPPDKKAVQFVHDMQEAGIRVVFTSNNVEECVETFMRGLQADCYPLAMKPLSRTYRRVLKEQGVDEKEVVMVGDQLTTGILEANLMGLHTALTAPMVTRDLSSTRFNRFFKSVVFRLLQITRRSRKGEYDE